MDPARNPRQRARPALKDRIAASTGAKRRDPRARRRERRILRAPAGSRRWRDWLRPPRVLRPTRAGWCFFAVVFGVGFAALNTGNNLLYLVLSLLLAFLALSGVLSESALRGIEVRRHAPREWFANTDNPVSLEVCNRQRHVPAFAVVVEDRVARHATALPDRPDELRAAGRAFVLRIPPGASEVRRYQYRPEQRGDLRFVEFQVSTRFPFGLFLKSMTIRAPQRATVYPEIEKLRVPPGWADATTRNRHNPTPSASRQGASASGLSEYRQGDPRRRIHWKSSLRRGKLLVREFEDERSAEVEVHLRTHSARPGPAFEERVRWAASELVAQLDAGYRVALRTDGERLSAATGDRHRAALLGFLARVQPQASAAAGRDVA